MLAILIKGFICNCSSLFAIIMISNFISNMHLPLCLLLSLRLVIKGTILSLEFLSLAVQKIESQFSNSKCLLTTTFPFWVFKISIFSWFYKFAEMSRHSQLKCFKLQKFVLIISPLVKRCVFKLFHIFLVYVVFSIQLPTQWDICSLNLASQENGEKKLH